MVERFVRYVDDHRNLISVQLTPGMRCHIEPDTEPAWSVFGTIASAFAVQTEADVIDLVGVKLDTPTRFLPGAGSPIVQFAGFRVDTCDAIPHASGGLWLPTSISLFGADLSAPPRLVDLRQSGGGREAARWLGACKGAVWLDTG